MNRGALLVALLLACVAVASAQSPIDPTIILNGPGDPTAVESLTFSGAFTPTGTPPTNICPEGVPVCFDGQNQTGFHWVALSITYTFTLANSTPLTISCMSNLFDLSNCASGVPVSIAPEIDPIGTVTLRFACSAEALASDAGCGITNFTPLLTFDTPVVSAQNSFLNFIDPNSTNAGDILNTSFTATASPIPEPGTLTLMGTGLVALLRRRLRRRSRS
jgi:PEP-CTERM motif-containing protein